MKKEESAQKFDSIMNKKCENNRKNVLKDLREAQKQAKRIEASQKLEENKLRDSANALNKLNQNKNESKKKEATDKLSKLLDQKKKQQEESALKELLILLLKK